MSARFDTATGLFTGYASLFGLADAQKDVVEPGAFAATLARRGPAGIRMLWQHDPATPLGLWLALTEDERGLRVTGKLTTSTARGAETLDLLRAGALDGLSIGFKAVKAAADRRRGLRRLIEIDLWEVSIVTFPALPGARVTALG
ncbi:HK97 family phage prohead protease [Phreatobacter aquaticus]|uniref:HK97 family phage prohead protease n=1 Tax=Phreatobacter aquaticus TaxID=2570229 RepID=A0A4D7QLU9_9HYPH|nr:HK97 family phage prohead protease [Phreatobacter aquaticus]QCK86619.1 HK97 family phage prohead protease [Phreatobacter aquaticus]